MARIAAGEAIERPASAVKELVENALDAGATEIAVDVAGGGLDFMRVADNGAGIAASDAELVCRRHATSKIGDEADLERIVSFGFRGEALASLVAIASLTLATSDDDQGHGWQVVYQDGELRHSAPVARQRGTTVVARGLFATMPARRKFLAAGAGETARIAQIVRRFALLHAGVQFSLAAESRLLLRSSGSGRPDVAAGECWGAAVRAGAIELRPSERGGVALSGWIGDRAATRATRAGIVLAVNGRPVRAARLQEAMERAYRPLFPRGRHPFAVVRLECDPADVDPNVHPAKEEVLLRGEDAVAALLAESVREALASATKRPDDDARSLSAGQLSLPIPRLGSGTSKGVREDGTGYGATDTQASRALSARMPRMRLVGQVQRTLIVLEDGESVLLVDQHRAHERVLYERLLAGDHAPAAQALLEPMVLEVKPHEVEQFHARLTQLEALGFRIERAAGLTFLIQAIPVVPGSASSLRVDGEVLQEMTLPGDRWRDRLYTAVACRTAVRRGRDLELPFVRQLVYDLAATGAPAVCPHGSPLILEVTGRFLQRQFDWA